MSHHDFTTLEDLRDNTVRQFGCYMLCKLVESDAATPDDVVAAMDIDNLRSLLDMQELETIVREFSNIDEPDEGVLGIGTENREEFEKMMADMMTAIKKRIISNFMESGVKQGFLEAEFDAVEGQFQFSLTDKAIEAYRNREKRKRGEKDRNDELDESADD